ncbi:MAG: aspartate aminotransferase family protein [Firmicutes bacterium]|nr:aspartate aminotransferase family protein [Bacillota bacterium]MCL5040729.1 aspartate aminotransferase family protein [Bacillota bacterium]
MRPAALPKTGRDKEDILRELRNYQKDDPSYERGRVWSLVYYLGAEHDSLLQEAYNYYFSANALNPMAFKSLKRLENEIIWITAALLHGDGNVCGVMTSGGTESCLLAVKTYRDYARAEKGTKNPEMILPQTAHVAWEKGGEYFGVKPVYVPLDDDYKVDVEAVKRLINKNTIMILGSAPDYPHGIIDPIEELGRIGESRGIPVHVDACLGGFILPFIEKLGISLPKWDYRVPGVTSISADLHKYGFAAKGASTITYRSLDILKYQMFVSTEWPGGVFASPALLGTRPGGAYAAAWASLQALGEDGFVSITKQVIESTRKLMEGIRAIPGSKVIGRPQASIFSFRSIDANLNIFAVADQMEQKGWHMDRLQKPDAIHVTVTPAHSAVIEEYLTDLKNSVEYVRKHPESAASGSAATYGMIAHIPLRRMVKKQVLEMFAQLYGPEGKMINMTSSVPGEENEGGIPTGHEESDKTPGREAPGLLNRIIAAYVKLRQSRE